MSKMPTVLFLDDMRDPNLERFNNAIPFPRPFNIVWVKSYNDFVNYVLEQGLPEYISFDHDLAEEHIEYYFANGGHTNPPQPDYSKFKEKTGMECAKFLVSYCMDHNKKLPQYTVHSNNARGRENIDGLLKSFIKHSEEYGTT